MKWKATILFTWIIIYILLKYEGFFNVNIYDLKLFMEDRHTYVQLSFLILFSIRFLVFIPSSLFIIVAAILFPTPFNIGISILGLLLTESLIFLIARNFKNSPLHQYLENKYPTVYKQVSQKRNRFLLFSIAIPIAPTDLACFIIGTTKMDYFQFITIVLLGSLPIVLIYTTIGALFCNFIL